MKNEELKWKCVGHWYKQMYKAFLDNRVPEIPCNSCKYVETCTITPVEARVVLMENGAIEKF